MITKVIYETEGELPEQKHRYELQPYRPGRGLQMDEVLQSAIPLIKKLNFTEPEYWVNISIKGPGIHYKVLQKHTLLASEAIPPADVVAKLTRRQHHLLSLLLAGHDDDEIATQLCIEADSVNKAIQRMYPKFNVHDRAQLILFVQRNRLLFS